MEQPRDVFLSYAHEDRATAERIADCVGSTRLGVWWDRQIPAGERFEPVIRQALAKVRCVLVLWTSTSVRADRDWVRSEATRGLSRGVLLQALFVAPDRLPLPFDQLQGVNLREWDGSIYHPSLPLCSPE